MPPRQPLTVAVITLDEERNLDRCLRSVAWAEERVVVDSGSTDRTREIALRHGARFLESPWTGFAEQKNRAIDAASHEWVLSLDADEWLTPAGSAELQRALEAPGVDAYELNRRSALSGGFVDSAWSRDWNVRLFRRTAGRFGGGPVHESFRLAPGSRVQRLRERMLHIPYGSFHEYVQRMNRYTDLAADGLIAEGRPFRWSQLLLSPPAAFVKHLLLRRGFRDGVRGLVVSAGAGFYALLKYGKHWERTREPDPELVRLARASPEDPDRAER